MFFVDSYFLLHSGGVLELEAPRALTSLQDERHLKFDLRHTFLCMTMLDNTHA